MPTKCLIARYIAAINGRIINEKSRRHVAGKLLSSTNTSFYTADGKHEGERGRKEGNGVEERRRRRRSVSI